MKKLLELIEAMDQMELLWLDKQLKSWFPKDKKRKQ
jgi:hypothetical protein